MRVTQGKDIIRLRTLVDAKGHSRVLWPNVIAAWLGVVAWVSLTILLLIAAMISFVGGGPPVIPSLLVSIIPASIVVFMGLRLPPTAKGIVAPPVNSGREQTRPAPVSLTPPLKSARGKFTTPEYLATPLGGFLKHQGEGELSLHADHLVFAAGGQRTAIPFSAIKQIGAARGPRWTSPAGHQYLWLDYEDGGQQRQLLFMAGTGLFRFAGETADTAAEWIEAIQGTARAGGYPPIPGLPVTPLVVPASPWISLAVVLPLLVIALLAPLAATRELRLSPIEILLVAIGPLFLIGGLGAALSHFMRLRLPPAAKGVVAPPGSSGREQPPSEQSAIRNPQSAMDQSLLTSAPTGRLWRGPAVVLALLYGALLILLFTTVPDLPQRMAIHFNADGQADNWASRTTHALFIAGMPLLITALFSGLAALTLKFPKKLVNIPRRDYWLAPERAQFTTALMLRWMLWLACLMTIYFGALHWIVLLANQTQPAKISMSEMLPLVIGFLIGCMIWTTSLAMRFAEAERYEQSLKDRFNRARPFSVRRQIISAALTLTFIFVTRTWLASTYTIKTDALTPELPTGSLVLAWKLNRNYAPGDLIVYRHSKGHASVGRITASESDAVLVNRNDQPGFRVERAKIEGKVISVLWRSAARDPNWVSVSLAKSTPDASIASASNASGGVIMNWEVQASQPGLVSLLREGGQSTASLKRDPKTKLHQIAVRVELTQAGTDRVLLVTTLGGSMAREELPGDLRELSAELLRSKNQSATTVRGTEIELCRFQGKPIKVLVPVLAVADPSAAPNTVQVFGQSKSYESTVTLSWEVSASQPGLAGFSRRSPIMVLKQDSKGNRHRVSASLELTRLDGDRVQFVRRIGQNDLREEIDGNFRELADELLRTANFRINATSGTPIELCQFQGKPFTVQVYGQTSTVTTSSPAKMVSWRLLIFLTIGLLVVAGGIVLLVVLWRKGGTAGKVVALVIAVPLLLLAMVVAVLLGSRGSGPGFTAAQLAKSEQVVLDPNNPGPVASHPPGQVQQPQNGFRLQQPAAVPKSGAAPDPAAAIEMKVALQQLEKTLTSLADTEAEIASLQLSLGAAHPSVEALRSKMIVLEKEAARLRSDIEAKQTRSADSSDPVLTIETAPPKSRPEAAKSADERLWIASVTNQLGRLCLYGVLAVAFYVARRRTSLLGFRLLFVFAVGELALMIIGFFMASWLAINFGVQASNYFAYARAALDFALYAVAFAGVISLLVSWRRSPN